jgi:hypothetical protein
MVGRSIDWRCGTYASSKSYGTTWGSGRAEALKTTLYLAIYPEFITDEYFVDWSYIGRVLPA